MWFNFVGFFVQVIIFVVVVRIIVGAVAGHNRHLHARGGCCYRATIRATPVGMAASTPAQVSSTPAPAPVMVTEVKHDEAVPVAPVHEARFCPACGAARSPGARFCTMCGSELE